jgi:orotidine-5'-phosphate decarboxylase
VLQKLKEYGNVMCDLKLYDIPNTVKNRCKRLQKHGDNFELLTVHAHGGIDMMKTAVEIFPNKIVAVTVLTSFSEETYQHTHLSKTPIAEHVKHLATDAQQANVPYLVCSGQELEITKSISIKKIVPGIRPKWNITKNDDQQRIMTPAQAIKAGASLLVIGRPITGAIDPKDAAKKTLDEINSLESQPEVYLV